LNTLDGKTTVTVDATAVNSITGSVAEVDALYNSTGVSNLGNDTVNISTAGNFTSDNFNHINVGDIDTLNFATSADSVSFTNVANFENWRSKFTNIDFGSSSDDSISFSSSVSGDLDFSNVSNLENLNLSSIADSLTISGDEPDTINGLGGNDTFALDFSNINNFSIDGGADTDTLSISVSDGNVLAGNFSNFEVLNLSGLGTIQIEDTTIDSWSSNGDSLSLSFGGNSTYNYSTDGGSTWTSGTLTLDDTTSGNHYIVSMDTTYDAANDLTLQVI
jgi:hypothetical protein